MENIVRELNRKVKGFKIGDVWTDWPRLVKNLSFAAFRRNVAGRRILGLERRGKNILFKLDKDKALLVHLKMSGRFLMNQKDKYTHLVFQFDRGKFLALSDMRKFARLALLENKSLDSSPELKNLGPDPFQTDFAAFKRAFLNKKGRIKSLLLNQNMVSGIGNIYADETLWLARVHPLENADLIGEDRWLRIYKAARKILKEAIRFKGTSIQTYRLPSGEKGGYQKVRRVYRRTGEPCFRCGTPIQRIKLSQRSTHFCPACQSL